MTTAFPRPALDVAEVIRRHGAAFLARHGSVLSAVQRQALHDLAVCRTAALRSSRSYRTAGLARASSLSCPGRVNTT